MYECVCVCVYVFIYFFIFYIPWIFWDKPHLHIGIVNTDMNTLYNVMMCMLQQASVIAQK